MLPARKRSMPKRFLDGESQWTARQETVAGSKRNGAGPAKKKFHGVSAAAGTPRPSVAAERVLSPYPSPTSQSPIKAYSNFSLLHSVPSAPLSVPSSPISVPLPSLLDDAGPDQAADRRSCHWAAQTDSALTFRQMGADGLDVAGSGNSTGHSALFFSPPRSRPPSSLAVLANVRLASPLPRPHDVSALEPRGPGARGWAGPAQFYPAANLNLPTNLPMLPLHTDHSMGEMDRGSAMWTRSSPIEMDKGKEQAERVEGMDRPSTSKEGAVHSEVRGSMGSAKKASRMASVDLRDEVTCAICLSIYTDPVTLPCGHSFCRICIGDVMDTRKAKGYSCPECRDMFKIKPELKRNLRLSNIAESFKSVHQARKKIMIPCTNCFLYPVPAVKTCLHCEACLCEDHLRVHSKSAEHVLTEPTTSLENRKCSVHKENLKYYCCEDATCICVSCSLAGEHRGHQVETLNEASEKKKEKLRNIVQKLTSQREEAEKRVQNLEELRIQVQEKASGVTERVTALIRDIREQLETLEKRVLSEISRQEEQVSLRVSDLIRHLELKKEELSRKMGDIEKLCDMTDPLTVLQGRETDRADYCDAEDTERPDIKVHDVGDLDVGLISVTLYSGLDEIVTRIPRRRRIPEASYMLLDVNMTSDMLLDVNTACNYVSVSEDFKTVSWSEINQSRPYTVKFQDYAQVLSSSSFSSGRHYWEVEVSESGWRRVGMAYPSIERRGWQSWIGYNKRSWGLERSLSNVYSLRHDNKSTYLSHPPSCHRFGIFLDYEAGRLSFYELCDPIRHLHTFTATFTKQLHGVFCVDEGGWIRVI
uniref:Uncharacterized protein n=1 Tax=Leptobrachium leishanense TaxID=445787 RepID=A0A8C5PRK2_9ANUR